MRTPHMDGNGMNKAHNGRPAKDEGRNENINTQNLSTHFETL